MSKYNDDFYYGYRPKGEAGKPESEADKAIVEEIDRDISSFSRSAMADGGKTETPPVERPVRRTARPVARGARPTPSHTKSPAPSRSKRKAAGKKVIAVIDNYGNFCFKNLGNIIKIIAFVIAFAVIIACLILGFTIFRAKAGLSLLSLLVIVGGTAFAAILFFPIYGIGHIICQNNEILRIFNESEDE